MSASEGAIPVCAWICMELPGFPTFIGFTYVARVAGLSAKGGTRDDPNLAEAPLLTVRLPMPGIALEPLGEEEIQRLGLPRVPSWVEQFYGPQPLAGRFYGEWRLHPRMKGRFHPDSPDDLQVVVHDGGPRLTAHRPELVWVRVMGCNDDVYHGRPLNQPHQLTTVSEEAEIDFVVPDGGKHPLMVTPKYLRERPDWIFGPCNKCGLTELFDAPSDLIRIVFPNVPPGATMAAFSTFCGVCGGIQIVRPKDHSPEIKDPATPGQRHRGWWQFWK
jgi:hypothetical protein